MTVQKPTSLEITDPQIAALLIKENVSAYLAQFVGKETTVKDAALAVNVKLNIMAYWANRFLKFGLIQITRIETRGGSAIKHYQSVAAEFALSTNLLEGFNNTEILERIMQRHYGRFTHSVAEYGTRLTPDWRLRLFRDAYGYGLHLEPIFQQPPLAHLIPKRPLHDWADITMPAEKAAEFRAELEALFERFKTNVHLDPQMPRFIMHVGFVEDAN
jgi:hypothetical protein